MGYEIDSIWHRVTTQPDRACSREQLDPVLQISRCEFPSDFSAWGARLRARCEAEVAVADRARVHARLLSEVPVPTRRFQVLIVPNECHRYTPSDDK